MTSFYMIGSILFYKNKNVTLHDHFNFSMLALSYTKYTSSLANITFYIV